MTDAKNPADRIDYTDSKPKIEFFDGGKKDG